MRRFDAHARSAGYGSSAMPPITDWKLAPANTSAPAMRSYWVIDALLLAGAYPESPKPEERGRRVEALWKAGIRTFLDLTEEDERSPVGADLVRYAPAVAAQAARMGERAACLRLPVRDLSVPSIDGMRTILGVLDLALEARRPVYVHCLGGIGRTGTVIGCWMRRHGLATRDDVLAVLAQLRRADAARAHLESPEMPAQRAMVLDWSE